MAVDLGAAKAQFAADHPAIGVAGDATLVQRGTVVDSATVVQTADALDGGDCVSG